MTPYLIEDESDCYNDAALQCRLELTHLEYTHKKPGSKHENSFMGNLRRMFYVAYPKTFIYEIKFQEALFEGIRIRFKRPN